MHVSDSEVVDRLIYRISHDLCASVRALVELPKWISEDLAEARIALPEDIQNNLDIMGVNGRRLDRMINDLVMYSRIGRFQETEVIDPAAVVDEIMEHLSLPPGFTLERHLTTAGFEFAQPDFSRICHALLSNAVKHHDGPDGKIKIDISKTSRHILICVEDDGPGVPKDQHGRICEIFTTLKPRDQVEGSGMGLALVSRIVQNHQGTLRFAPARSGRGLKATVRLALNGA